MSPSAPLRPAPRLLASITALATLVGLAGCGESSPAAPAEPAAAVIQGDEIRYPSAHPQLALLKTVDVRPASAVAIELPARLTWNETRTQRIYPPLAGRVTQIRADVGQTVQPGTVLATIASPDLGQAQADAARARVDVALAEKTRARQQELLAGGVVARKDFEQADADLGRARAEAARSETRLRLYGGGNAVNQQLAIIAGIKGVVVERNLNPGQELRPDQSGVGVPALFVLSDPTSLWVQIDARESDLATLKPGAQFDLVAPALGGQTVSGRVQTLADAIDPATRTIKVRGEVTNPDRRLKAEMLVNARIERHLGGGVVVPSQALILRGGQHFVFVRTGPTSFARREVKLSWQESKQAVVARGLEVGDQVVGENALLLAREFRLLQDKGGDDAGAATPGATDKPSERSSPVRAVTTGNP
ncbi:MAG: efflux RND transporter periplasmic adaptor subunit [Burkholderiales bacterium]|nr:efflux RND transporter periplasmic adaptor subunit [Burkholderiales bacterium]